MDQIENPSEKGKNMFLDLCESKKYKEISVRLNKKGEIYFIEATKTIQRRTNDGIILSHHIPKSGYHNVNVSIIQGKIAYVTSSDHIKIDGVESNKD
jgi:hypothetical protein